MTSRVAFYVLAVCLASLAAVALLCIAAPTHDPTFVKAALTLSALGVLSNLLVYELPRGGRGSIAFIPFIATALVSPNWIAVAAVAGASSVTEAISRRGVLKAAFNVAQMALATSVAILAYIGLGGTPLLHLGNGSLPDGALAVGLPFLALVTLFVGVNTLAVSGVLAASSNKGLLQVWKDNTSGAVLYDVFSSPVVFLLGWLYVKVGWLGAAGLAVPMLGVRQLYKTNYKLEQINHELLQLMVKAIEARDPYTSGHSIRVAHYSKIIARALKLNAREVARVGTAALLHDVGKIHEVYAPILRKPGKLTAEEWAVMQTHPIRSAELVTTVSHLRPLVGAVRHHHENWDGSGYPDGLAGDDIPLESRIIMFADTIDAMTTDRPYRQALGEAEVRAELRKHRGRQFDPTICDVLLASPLFSELFAPRSPEFTPHSSPAAAA